MKPLPFVACVRPGDVPPGCRIPSDKHTGSCSSCQATIWIAPSTKQQIENHQVIPVCISCMDKKIQAGEYYVPMLSKEAEQDLKRWQQEDTERN